MPIIQSDATDEFGSIIRFGHSEVWEFLISFEAACHSWLFQSWTLKVDKALGKDFLNLYKGLNPIILRCSIEMAVDAPDRNDVSGFLDFVEDLSPEDYCFYAMGRVVPREEIRLPLTSRIIDTHREWVETTGGKGKIASLEELYSRLNDPAEQKEKLLGLWRDYYNNFYRHESLDFSFEYETKFREWEDVLNSKGGEALYQYIHQSNWMPPPYPPGQEYSSIDIIPLHFLPERQRTYYGYGNIVVLGSSQATPESKENLGLLRDDLVTQLKALGDPSRLDILRLVLENEFDMNGKRIAESLNISPSVVSRHLKQLKSAGIIEEKTTDNRNFTYRVNRDSVLKINRRLQYFLTEKKD